MNLTKDGKRILIFSLAYHPLIGGAEIAVREVTKRIPSRDISFDLITLRFSRGHAALEMIDNVTVHRIGFGGSYLGKIFFPLQAMNAARRLHRKNSFDGIWALMTYMVLPVVLMRFLGIRLPYLITLQDGDTFEHVFKRLHIVPFLPAIRYGFRHAAGVQAISTYLLGWAKKMGYPGDVVLIPNGFDFQLFDKNNSQSQNRKVFWENKKVIDTGVILVTTSRLVRKNAIDSVIQALPLLPEEVSFVVLGDGPLRGELEKLADDLGVRGRTWFLGEIPNAYVAHYLSASDIFIRPSRSEGMGTSFIEAMASGIPVVATSVGGIPDFLKDGETGVFCKVDDPKSVKEAVTRLLGDGEFRDRIVKNAKKLVVENYSWELIARDMKNKAFGSIFKK